MIFRAGEAENDQETADVDQADAAAADDTAAADEGDASAADDQAMGAGDQETETPEPPSADEASAPASAGTAAGGSTLYAPGASIDALRKAAADPSAFDMDGNDMARQLALFAQDREMGHIHPKTLHELYEDKKTPGKIATLFGLLVGGMGSGLTGQPNVALEMMNKEIERDLDAQKNSNTNAQNWYKLSLEHNMQRAEIPGIRARTELNKSEKSRQDVLAQIDAIHGSKAMMTLDMLGNVRDTILKMPPDSPIRKQMEVAYGQLEKAANQSVQNSISQAKGQKALVNSLAPPPKSDRPEGTAPISARVDTKKVADIVKRARLMEGQGGAGLGALSSTQQEQLQGQAALVNANREALDAWGDAFKKLTAKPAGDVWNPEERNAIITPVRSALINTGMSHDDVEKTLAGILPNEKDVMGARHEKAQKGLEHFIAAEAGKTALLDNAGLKPKFPPPPKVPKGSESLLGQAKALLSPESSKAAPKESGGKKEGETSTDKDGKPIVWRNGSWRYQKK